MGIKESIRNFCFKITVTKKIYHGLSWIKGWLYYAVVLARPILKHKALSEKPVFLVFTPQHANLGDHAIACAEKKLLDNIKLPYYEITGEQLRILDSYKLLGILDKSLILINGGGNIGTLWPSIECLNRSIVTTNPNATIVVLPNTMYYGKSVLEQKEFALSKQIYNAHPRLYFYAREPLSFAEMKKAFRNVKMVPDVVLSLDYTDQKYPRSGGILCLRADVEATLSQDEANQIETICRRIFGDRLIKSDTVLDHDVPVASREEELAKKLKEFASAELVITDRLHGMIFCAITGTNCIVINSRSPKLRGCYEWIKDLGYIRFAEDINDIESIYSQIKSGENVYNNNEIMGLMRTLEQDIMNMYSA